MEHLRDDYERVRLKSANAAQVNEHSEPPQGNEQYANRSADAEETILLSNNGAAKLLKRARSARYYLMALLLILAVVGLIIGNSLPQDRIGDIEASLEDSDDEQLIYEIDETGEDFNTTGSNAGKRKRPNSKPRHHRTAAPSRPPAAASKTMVPSAKHSKATAALQGKASVPSKSRAQSITLRPSSASTSGLADDVDDQIKHAGDYDSEPTLDDPTVKPHLNDATYGPLKVETIWTNPLLKNPTVLTTAKLEVSRRPLVFIKGMKVGGTSVAGALNQVANHYGLPLAPISFDTNNVAHRSLPSCDQVRGGVLYFRHGFKNTWQHQCMDGVRYVTVLRDPVTATISLYNFFLNAGYFRSYPTELCSTQQFIDIERSRGMSNEEIDARLQNVSHCNDTPYRRNLTLLHIANRVRELSRNDPGQGIRSTVKWISGEDIPYRRVTGEDLISILSNQYYLVAVTERINEFLTLLALTNGWDLPTVTYRKCKRSNLDVSKSEFKRYFPSLTEKLETAARPMNDAYRWAREQFDEHVAELGDWFTLKVQEFETKLRKYQDRTGSDFHWRVRRYIDGHTEVC